MIDERTAGLIESLASSNSEFLTGLENRAIEEEVPIIRKDTQEFIKYLMKTRRPENILEIGTAVGFSAILMAENTPDSTRILTVEDYPKRVEKARENLISSGYSERITLREGDGEAVMKELNERSEKFDFIFIDAAKAQYPNYLHESLSLLKDRGMLLADNCLKGGEIVESKFAVTRRNRTIHKRMREFLYEVTHNEELNSVILPVGDGMVMAEKTGKRN
ncbi:MAG: O-methyltransferase [Lachnospiraceae bacterium]|nr:O-methyltransferase [Lachnospiraceae bacterium]